MMIAKNINHLINDLCILKYDDTVTDIVALHIANA